ncbi:unnamed protein product [Sympodiomycopsis kandeliae]
MDIDPSTSTASHLKRSADTADLDVDLGGMSSSSCVASSSSSSSSKMAHSSQQQQTSHCTETHLDIEAIKQELTCNICLDLPHRIATVLPCLHSFCWTCIQEWFKAHTKCPRCAQVGTEAKPNAALNNLVGILQKAQPDLRKPQDLIDQEDRAFAQHKLAHGTQGRIVQRTIAYYEDDSEDEDDPQEEDRFLHFFWPCPCCEPGNPSGFVCQHPIVVPPENQAPDQRPERGLPWPSLELLGEHLPMNIVDDHTSCSYCRRWIPVNGVPKSRCDGCDTVVCAPYDAQGECPGWTGPWGPLKDHDGIMRCLADVPFQHWPSTSELNFQEQQRVQQYCLVNQVSPRDIYQWNISQAEALHNDNNNNNGLADDSAAAAADQAQPDTAQPLQGQQQAQPDTAQPLQGQQQAQPGIAQPNAGAGQGQAQAAAAPIQPNNATDNHLRCLTDESCHSLCSDECASMSKEKAKAILEGHYCEVCSEGALHHFIQAWWTWIHLEKKDTLPAEVRDLPDCWYGRECRTQFHSDDHARRYNHVCNNIKRNEAVVQPN